MVRFTQLPAGQKECALPGCNNAFKQYKTTDKYCSRVCYLMGTKNRRTRLSQRRSRYSEPDRVARTTKLDGLSKAPAHMYDQIAVAEQTIKENQHGSKFGWLTVGGKRYHFRSSWERNIARYLQWLKLAGNIKDWEYECQMFEFDGIRHGTTRYLPDFKVYENDGSHYFIEVKGYMTQKDRTKLKRMAKYHPAENVQLLDAAMYKDLTKQLRPLITDWE